MVLNETKGERPGEVVLSGHENPLPRHEHIVEDGDRLHHLVFGAQWRIELALRAAAVRAGHQLQAGRVHGDGERQCVVLVALTQRPRGQHDELVHVGRTARVELRPADHDAIRPAFDDTGVHVGVGLVARPCRTVALHIRLRDRDREIVIAAVPVERLHPPEVIGLVLLVHLARYPVEREEGIGADLLHQDHQGLPQCGRRLDELAPLEQVIGVRGDLVVAAVLLGALGHHGEVAVGRVLRHLEVDGGVVHGLLDDRVGRDIGHLLATIEHGPPVLERVNVLLGGAESHSFGSVLRLDCLGPIPLAHSF